MTQLSAVIPSRDRVDVLGECLATLAAQTTPVEVIVVDDGSTEDVAGAVETARRLGLDVRCLRQDGRGANAARNHGAAHARGDVLAFLDDDVLLAGTWADALLASHTATAWDAAAGRTELKLPFEPRWLIPPLREALSEFDYGTELAWLPEPLYPWTCNCAITREMFERAGGFETSMGRDGTSLMSNDELALFRRLRALGGRIAYVPAAHAMHQVAAARLAPGWFVDRAYCQGYSDERLAPAAQDTRSRGARVPRILLGLRSLPRILGSAAVNRHGFVHARCQVAYVRGALAAVRDGATGT